MIIEIIIVSFKKIKKILIEKHGNRLPREVVDVPSLETPKVRLGKALRNLIQL